MKLFENNKIKELKCKCLGCESGEVCKKEIRIDTEEVNDIGSHAYHKINKIKNNRTLNYER